MLDTAYRQLVRLSWAYLGKDIHVPLPCRAVLGIQEEHPSQDHGGFHEVQELLSYWESSLALKWLLCSSTACVLSFLSILDARVGGFGLSAVVLVHNSTTSEETQFTYLPKYVEYHVNS